MSDVARQVRPVARVTSSEVARDHGGNLDAAIARFGGVAEDWIDLSTGINPKPYPLPDLSADIWHRLPTSAELRKLVDIAANAYRTRAAILPLAGAQAAIQLYPRLRTPGTATILGPTYNEHKTSLHREGWTVREVATFDDIAGSDIAVVVNPNNPDGRTHQPDQLLDIARRVKVLVVDESFVDATPELSLAPYANASGIVVLRSFGKFYGLAGLRLGFAIGDDALIAKLAQMAGPWQVSGPAIAIGTRALSDNAWQRETTARCAIDAKRLDASAALCGWQCVGGTHLFRLYGTENAARTQAHLARHKIWSRIFPWSETFIRLGLPGSDAAWSRLEAALKDHQS